MNAKSTIQKQLLALLLIGVFLFIHVGKAFHSHELLGNTDNVCQTGQVSKSNDCSVCDFHFTKDTEHQIITVNTEHPTPILVQHAFLQSRKASSIGLSYADRGPPAIA